MNDKKTQDAIASAFNLQNGWTDSVRDLVGIQFKAAQLVMDKTMGFGQTVTDYMQNQVNESMKLSQEAMKYGWTLTENIKKSAYEITDRALRNPQA